MRHSRPTNAGAQEKEINRKGKGQKDKQTNRQTDKQSGLSMYDFTRVATRARGGPASTDRSTRQRRR